MPVLTIRSPGEAPRTVTLVKAITSLGRGEDLDVALSDESAEGVVAIERDQGLFSASVVEGAGVVVNGKRLTRLKLQDGDRFRLGQTEVSFHLTPPARATLHLSKEREPDALEALSELYRFSERLLAQGDLEKLLEALVDGTIKVTSADKAFLVLVEDGQLHVRVARHLERHNVESAVQTLSDSIVRKALTTKKPVIVSDALNDQEFNSSESVVNLKLCSVLAVPLLDRQGAAFGLLYVGNDRVANHFDDRALALLTIYAAQASLLVRNAQLLNELTLENRALKKAAEEARFGEIIGSCDAMREVYRKLEKIAPTDISVLITGETGTGKELIARELHRRSPRKGGPFVVINCGAIPAELMESELFGHLRGAFTGAVATRIGRFQAANGGTLFLDEVGELPVGLQVKLLRALQEKVVTKVGDSRPEPVDIRIVAATNRVLEDELKAGRFREDLYYRLNVVGVHLPPLRDRGDDVEVIARHLLSRFAKELSSSVKGFAKDAVEALMRYAWPGNIRELENRLKKAIVLADGPLVTVTDLDLRPESLAPIQPLVNAIEEFKERYIDEVLGRNHENRTKTARDLGVDARTIFRYLERKRARLEGRVPLDEPEDEGSRA